MMKTLIAASFVVLAAFPGHSAVLLLDTFDTEAGALNTLLDNWDVIQGSVDVVGCGGSGACVDLDGSMGATAPTIIETKLSFGITAGNTYQLSLSFPFGTEADPFKVSFGTFSQSFVGGYIFPISPLLNFVAGADGSSKVRIELTSATNNNFGPYLTEFSLTEIVAPPVSAVPLPATALLLLGGIGAFGLVRRRTSA